MRAPIRSLGIISLTALAMVTKAGAQGKVEFTPWAGAYVPTAALLPAGILPNISPIAPPPVTPYVRQNSGPALGGRVTVWLSSRFAIDGSYAYSASGAFEVARGRQCSGPEMCLALAGGYGTASSVSLVGARLLFVVVGHPSKTVLYLLGGPAYVGHGGPAYDPGPGYSVTEMSVSNPGAVVGIGAHFKAPNAPLALRADLEDYRYAARLSGQIYAPGLTTNWSSSRLQNDLLFSLGASVDVRGALRSTRTLLLPPITATSAGAPTELRAARAHWTVPDYVLVGASVALHVADWSQTAWALRHGASEANPLLGAHPSQARLAATDLTFLALYGFAEAKLRRDVGRALALLDITLEAFTIINNQGAGSSYGPALVRNPSRARIPLPGP